MTKQAKRRSRHTRIRTKIFGTSQKPRLCVFRSSRHIYVQIINDEINKIICSANDASGKNSSFAKVSADAKVLADKSAGKAKTTGKEGMRGKILSGFEIGKLIAERAMEKKIEKVVFDRGGYKYHGRIKAVAEGAREGGLKF